MESLDSFSLEDKFPEEVGELGIDLEKVDLSLVRSGLVVIGARASSKADEYPKISTVLGWFDNAGVDVGKFSSQCSAVGVSANDKKDVSTSSRLLELFWGMRRLLLCGRVVGLEPLPERERLRVNCVGGRLKA